VGKSSLLNAMLGRKGLARTSSTPGRTQMLNFFLVNDRFVLVDLPGYGYAKAPDNVARRWRTSTRRYVADADGLRGVVLLLDIRREPSRDDREFADLVRSARRPLVPVVTKCDKVGRGRRRERLRSIGNVLGVIQSDLVVTSAKTGEGRDEFWKRAVQLIDEL
jgi:GTP-binding protein